MRALQMALLVAMGVSLSALASEPISLSTTATVASADRALVFVHGLLGDPRTSFGKWPEIIAHDSTELIGHGKLFDIAVYSVDYTADFRSNSTLEEVSNGVASDLAASSIFMKHRHVFFVAHSLGGLVLKRTFALWKLQGKTLLLDRVVGVGMLGVPSSGAPLADLTNILPVAKVAALFGWNEMLVQDLTTDSGLRYLASLENNWVAIRTARSVDPARRTTPYVSCGYETKPQFNVLRGVIPASVLTVVPKLYAGTACDFTRGFPVSHTDLIKPGSEGDSLHLWLRDLLRASALRAFQEERYTFTTGLPSETSGSVLSRVEASNKAQEPARLDPNSQLASFPERVMFADEKSKGVAASLVLQGGPFYGATGADLWEAAARINKCLSVTPAPNRLHISLAVTRDVKPCGTNGALICAEQRCE